ncbi:lipopolysaccharide assembly protein A [Sphingomonas sp. F9_3S_D5_B_2]
MQFLKTLFWVLVAVLVALFAWTNWNPVTLNLWTDIQAETKLPMLVFVGFVIGWLPTWLMMRARIWTLRRRVEALDRQRTMAVAPAAVPVDEAEPAL